MPAATITRRRSAAKICRARGWQVGTRLVGDEGYGPTVIELTAIGEDRILAKAVSHNGEPVDHREGIWSLSERDWRPVTEAGPRGSGPKWLRTLLRPRR